MTNYLPEIEEQFNDIIITPTHNIARIIGYAEDGYDCYAILRYSNGKEGWLSLCVLYFPLKDKIDNYNELDESLNLNNCKRAEHFIYIDESDD